MSDTSAAIDRARRSWQGRGAPTSEELTELHAAAKLAPYPRSFTETLSEDRLALVVEPKRATARRGTINEDMDVASLVRESQAGGACAVSIVTESELSRGSIDDLVAARAACDLVVIARDFIVDSRQILQLRAAGADAVLIPAAAHVDQGDADEGSREHGDDEADRTDTFDAIVRTAHAVGMDVVLSVRTEEELAFAIETDADVLNIDNRGDDDRVDVERTFDLLADVPVGWPVISESIAEIDQVAKLQRAGVDGLLLDEGHLDTGLTSALAVYAEQSLDAD